MDDVSLARAIHVLAVLHWIGGVAFVTAVILPAARAVADPLQRLALFERVERRFSAQVRFSVPIAGLSGAYMLWRLDAWDRLAQTNGWWLLAMIALWALFMVVLFVVEPLFGIEALERLSGGDSGRLFAFLQRGHTILLALSLLTVAAAVLGAHGFLG